MHHPPPVTRRALGALAVAAVAASMALTVAPGTAVAADAPAATTRATITPSSRVANLVSQMTLDEKLSFVTPLKDPLNPGSVTTGSAAYIPGVPRLGIPEMRYTDGSAGLRLPIPATAYPVATMVGSTWEPDLAYTFGNTLGTEARAANQDVLLAPMVTLMREPQGGRNYEAYSEDPLLVAQMAGSEVSGVQDAGVIATLKHLAMNDQETNKGNVSAQISDQALHETQLAGFQAGVHAGAGAAMCAYNKVNGVYSCSNDEIMNKILKTQLDFQGWVMSDWGVTRAVTDLNAGLDQEMYWVGLQQPKLTTGLRTALDDGTVPVAALDDAVARILTSMEKVGLLDGASTTRPTFDLATGAAVAQKIAEEGGVLLKNGGTLPLSTGKTVAVFGPTSVTPKVSGILSAEVKSPDAKSPLQTITARAGATVTSVPTVPANATELQQAATTASGSDVAVVFVSDVISNDRALALSTAQNDLVNAVADANSHTIVVLNTAGPVIMPWLDKVDAVLEMYYPGVNGAQATTSLLYGDVNPSGKLTQTFPVSEDQTPFAGNAAQYPGVNNVVSYSEGVDVGYRGYERKNITPLFAFGHGLSYTTFAYSSPKVVQRGDSVFVSLTLKNTGTRAGEEVAQVYAGPSPTVTAQQSLRKLVGFQKVSLEAGESKVVEFPVDLHQFEYWDTDAQAWKLGTGARQFWIGGASDDTPLTTTARIFAPSTTPGPAVTLTASPTTPAGGWYSGTVTATATTSTEGAQTYVSVDSGQLEPYSGPVTVSGEGTHTVRAIAVDANETYSKVEELTVKIDQSAPTVKATSTANGRLTLAATDALSGVASTQYSLDAAKTWKAYTAPVAVTTSPRDVLVRATDVAGNTSQPVSVAVQGRLTTGKTKVAGTPKVGAKLKATSKGWTSGTKLTYQWQRGGKNIKGATKATYKVTKTDVGKKLRVVVTGKKVGYTTATASSTATKKAVKVGKVRITKKSTTLVAQTSGWKPAKVGYRWTVKGKVVGTSRTLKVKHAWAGTKVKVTVTSKKTGYASATKSATATVRS